MHSWGRNGSTGGTQISVTEPLEPWSKRSAWVAAACIGMKESYGVPRWMTYKYTLYVLFVCIYLAHIFAFQLYLIFKVYQRRDVRPAVYDIVQIVLFFLWSSVKDRMLSPS